MNDNPDGIQKIARGGWKTMRILALVVGAIIVIIVVLGVVRGIQGKRPIGIPLVETPAAP